MPKTTLSLAKTTQPTLSMVVGRPALFARLDSCAGRSGIWIQAPAGAGKSTLAASWLGTRSEPALWYQLDSADADVSSFLYYLRRTAIKHCPDSAVDLPGAPASPGDWATHARRLVRAIFERYDGRVLVVLDNYESIPPHSALHGLLAAALDEVPRGGGFVFIGRAGPPPQFARARANENLEFVGGDELRLSAEECRQLATVRRTGLPPEEVDRIHHASAGWVTGAILMMEYARPARRLRTDIATAEGSVLFDYLALEVFGGFDGRTREFLLAVCWPRRIDPTMAEALSGDPMARQLLMNLSRNNYFVSERDDGDACEFTLHPLLRDFLKAHARRTLPEAAVAAQLRRAAALLSAAGHPEEAVELLVDVLDWPPLEQVIADHAAELLRQGRHTVLSGWLEQLPRDRLQASPALLCWLGAARLRDAPREARQYFEAACRHGAATTPERVRALAGVCAGILAEMDDFGLLDAHIGELAAMVPADAIPADEESLGAALVLVLAIALRAPFRDDLPVRVRSAEQALARAPAAAQQEDFRHRLMLACLLAGDVTRAGELLAQVPATAAAGMLRLLNALERLLAGDTDTARRAADACARVADEQSQPRLAALARACTAAQALSVHDAVAADGALAALDDRVSRDPNRLLRFLLHYLVSWRSLCAGDHVTALHRQRQAQSTAVELGIPFLEVIASCAYAQLLFHCDDERGGSAQLRRVHSVARDMKNPFLEFITLLIYGEAAAAHGRVSSGANAMRYALGLGRQHAFYFVPWWHPRQLADALVLAFRQGIERDYVRDFVRRNGLVPGTPPVDLPDWPWPLRIRTFGGLEIADTAGNRPEIGRANARPLQLLRALAAHGGADVPADRLAALLWPHVDSLYSQKSLTINLHRLRKLLGDDDAVLLRDGRLSLNRAVVYVDTLALDHVAARVTAAARSGEADPGPALEERVEALLDIYRGPFLGDEEPTEYVLVRREHCRRQLESVLQVWTGALAPEEPARALQVYERALGRDPGAEGLYRQLMTLYARCGRRADAVSAYERCCNALATLCRRAPSAETIAVHAAITASA
jgi:ATP/maltotriose-dependent transcriptional regulator MalT/DNA-binding SARP family transcriptional activator